MTFAVRELAERDVWRLSLCFSTVALLLLSLLAAAPGFAATPGWTFCVAEGANERDIWITAVFVTSRERERLEGEFSAYLKTRGFATPVAQCPAPIDDKTEMVNSQFVAVEFHRKLGDFLHEVTTAEFEPRR